MIGTTLHHYRILRAIGKGGMGEVYAAEDTLLHRQVALKILPQDMAPDPDRLERFRREAQALAPTITRTSSPSMPLKKRKTSTLLPWSSSKGGRSQN